MDYLELFFNPITIAIFLPFCLLITMLLEKSGIVTSLHLRVIIGLIAVPIIYILFIKIADLLGFGAIYPVLFFGCIHVFLILPFSYITSAYYMVSTFREIRSSMTYEDQRLIDAKINTSKVQEMSTYDRVALIVLAVIWVVCVACTGYLIVQLF